MASTRYAVLIGNGTFHEEPELASLRCPARDVRGMAELLDAPDRGSFDDTRILVDRPHHEIARTIQDVLHDASAQDLVLLYYSGHGKLNRRGKLHLAAANTSLRALESTSVPLTAVREFVDVSSCRRVVLVLDCCYSGAAGDAFVTKGGIQDELQIVSGGRGTYIMTASTGTDVAHEREDDEHSVFTKHMLEGLRSGRADSDGDGWITVDELYDYVRRAVARDTGQEPTKWGFDVRGDLIVARSGQVPAAAPPPTPPATPPVIPRSTEPEKPAHAATASAGRDLRPWLRPLALFQVLFVVAALLAAAFAGAFLTHEGRVTRTEVANGFLMFAGPFGVLASFLLGLFGVITSCRAAVLLGWVYPFVGLAAFVLIGWGGGFLIGWVPAFALGVFVGGGILAVLWKRNYPRLPRRGGTS